MSRSRRVLGVAALALSVTACFHQTVHSGLTPSTTVIERPYVATWLWGIIPADTIDVRESCPTGVATVETQQSFMNGFVSFFTLGIYAPQRLRVTCAS